MGGSVPDGSLIKNPPVPAGDEGLISRAERSPREEMAIHSSTLAWKIPWTEESGKLKSQTRLRD